MGALGQGLAQGDVRVLVADCDHHHFARTEALDATQGFFQRRVVPFVEGELHIFAAHIAAVGGEGEFVAELGHVLDGNQHVGLRPWAAAA